MIRTRKYSTLVTICAILAGIMVVPAFANGHKGNSVNAHEKVTICHATPPATAANGYVRITPSAAGVYNGHLKRHDADIIPPFTYNGQTYSQNWDAQGQAIWNNGCKVPMSTTTTSTIITITTSGSNSGSSSSGEKLKGVKSNTPKAKAVQAQASFTG